MPPKKRLRGTKLTKIEEHEIMDTDDFNNSQDEGDGIVGDVRNLHLDTSVEDIVAKAMSEKRMRKLVVDAFRLTFQSRGNINQDISLSTQKILRAYQRAKVLNKDGITNNIDAFFSEIDIRLTMLLDEVSVVEHRARVFKMLALTTVEMMKSKEKNVQLLEFLVNFLSEWGMSENVAARINTASFISYLFETGISKLEHGSDKFCGYSLEISEILFRHLKRALLDREFQSRVPAIRGMACLQAQPIPSNWGDDAKESSPRELLMRSFRDSSWECRLTAMQSFAPKESDVHILSDIILYDKCLKVRLAALEKFGEIRPNKYVRAKVTVLDLSLKDHEVSIRDRAKDVMKNWVKRLAGKWTENQKPANVDDIIETDVNYDPIETQEKKTKGYILAGQALVLLWLSDVPETVESHAALKRIIIHLFDVLRRMYICHLEPVNTFAEALMNDLREKMMANAVPIITKSTIGSILDTSEMALTQDAKTNRALVFFWRCLVEYLADRKRNDGDRTAALMRFLCPLKTMVEHAIRILNRLKDLETDEEFSEPDSTEQLYIIQMSVAENLLPVMRYTERDQSGLDAYKDLLISMMLNVCYQKKVVDIIVSELSQFYVDCPDDFFSMIYAKLNELRQTFKGRHFPELNGAILVGERKIREQYGDDSSNRGRRSFSDSTRAQIIDTYELMVINAALKVGILKQWDDEYDDRYASLFQRNVVSEELDCRILAVECIGIVGMYNIEKIETNLVELADRFDTEEDSVKAVFLTVITDLTIQHGLSTVDEILMKHSRTNDVISILTNIVMSSERTKESILLLKAVEGLSKILLQATIDPSSPSWQKAILSLMFRAAYAITDNFSARIRSTIIVMLKFFCSLSKNNQLLVVRAFPLFFDMWSNSSNVALLTQNTQDVVAKLKRCAATFVALTRHSVLPKEEQKKHQPTHVGLVNDILEVVTGSTESSATYYYLHALQCIDYDSFPRIALNKIYQDLVDYVEVHEDDGDRQIYNELRRASKKVAKILGINENAEYNEEVQSKSESKKVKKGDVELEEIMDDDGPSTSQQPARKGRTRKPTTTPADALDLMQSPPGNQKKPPSRPTTASRPATASTRTAPPRSARKLRSAK